MIYRLANLVPNLTDSNFIAPNATLIGDVVLGEHASVWFNVVIRADMETVTIGENTNIQDGSILHVDTGFPMTIGRDVTVGHKVMLHGCTIGDNTLVGMNAVVLNGANIGKNCLIGANSLVTENMQVPDGHLVLGSPAKVVKALDDATRAMFTKSAMHYVENGKRYLADLEPIDS
ncbi:gamma carbonic anhydrase family protein [Colwellia sp. Arc7-635]|uniref:gamma carbonic anhydrase family protein n=1 Tax=Colwellia sp. Arc7-635 TaxID=2497879 RepID=UPI000F8568A9|nr:gamma carbonic anhydrase family protein [Colwellia sp. Arc7-635]AZQ84800.1 gamma carbonic anhydrase family protein [Colwellia sp. Arc7-635]